MGYASEWIAVYAACRVIVSECIVIHIHRRILVETFCRCGQNVVSSLLHFHQSPRNALRPHRQRARISGSADPLAVLYALSRHFDGSTENKSSAVAEMGDRLATTDMGRKVEELLCPFPWGSWVPI